MELRLTLRDWAAWAPQLPRKPQWQDWAAAPHLPAGSDAPALADVPAMQRRRFSRLGRTVVQVTRDVRGERPAPMVFASRYGDVERALDALESLLGGQGVSPAVFAGSVHNGICAQLSIIEHHTQNMSCVAGGPCTAAVGMVEAAGLIAEGADEVILVCYDEPLPQPYDSLADEPQALFAWAWRLAPAGMTSDPDVLRLSRTAPQGKAECPTSTLPKSLEVLHWMLSGSGRLEQPAGNCTWVWSRDV